MIAALEAYWAERDCVVVQPYHTELGAGTFNPATFLRCLGPQPWRTVYVEPCIRPTDGRYGENPYRFQHYYQLQVVLKPSPEDILDQYFGSLEAVGIDTRKHDVRLVEDDWEGPTLGAWGLGWEVWVDGMEVTQFTYFQQLGGMDVDVVSGEITYGLERLAMFLQGKRSAFELEWAPVFTWGEIYKENERQWSIYNFEEAPIDTLMRRFEEHEGECSHLLAKQLPLPAYDQVLKASHTFNLLDARGAISVTERASYIGRVRDLARRVAEEYLAASVYEAEAQLPGLCDRHLGRRPDQVFVGPRRLAVLVSGLEERTGEHWVKGPPVELREKAAAGFAKRHSVAVEDLEERDGFLGVVSRGRALGEVLPGQLNEILRGLRFGKTMLWDGSGLRFPRPVRWTCARLDDQPVSGHGTKTYGHRFTHGEVDVLSADAYPETLREAAVEPDAAERERLIRDGLDALGGWRDPLGKLREVIHLVEWPLVLDGSFDERFLSLPERVIETAMQSHQRYFPLGGNRFALVANGGDPDTVRAGNETVLEGRLDDATFTFERDLGAGIEALAGRLGSIVYFAGAGTFADKTARLRSLVDRLGGGDASLEAARLAKADQAAELVREFPELEGYIGAEYARLAGFPEAVCAAIAEQYLPDSAGE